MEVPLWAEQFSQAFLFVNRKNLLGYYFSIAEPGSTIMARRIDHILLGFLIPALFLLGANFTNDVQTYYGLKIIPYENFSRVKKKINLIDRNETNLKKTAKKGVS